MKKTAELYGRDWITSRQKRRMDVLLAATAAPAALVVGLGAAALSRVSDGPGVIFRQERIGRGGEAFEMVKIRTMKGEGSGKPAKGLASEITALGRVLRPWGIDEAPQLLKVFDGTMSIVGPRASSPVFMEKISQALDRVVYDQWLDAYLSSRPGFLSTYHILDRAGIANKSLAADEGRLRLKAKADINDFNNASYLNDVRLMHSAAYAARALFNGGQVVNILVDPETQQEMASPRG